MHVQVPEAAPCSTPGSLLAPGASAASASAAPGPSPAPFHALDVPGALQALATTSIPAVCHIHLLHRNVSRLSLRSCSLSKPTSWKERLLSIPFFPVYSCLFHALHGFESLIPRRGDSLPCPLELSHQHDSRFSSKSAFFWHSQGAADVLTGLCFPVCNSAKELRG